MAMTSVWWVVEKEGFAISLKGGGAVLVVGGGSDVQAILVKLSAVAAGTIESNLSFPKAITIVKLLRRRSFPL